MSFAQEVLGPLREDEDPPLSARQGPEVAFFRFPDRGAAVAFLADALQRIVDDGELRRKLGQTGPSRILEGFHSDQMVESYLELYRQVLEEVRVAW